MFLEISTLAHRPFQKLFCSPLILFRQWQGKTTINSATPLLRLPYFILQNCLTYDGAPEQEYVLFTKNEDCLIKIQTPLTRNFMLFLISTFIEKWPVKCLNF